MRQESQIFKLEMEKAVLWGRIMDMMNDLPKPVREVHLKALINLEKKGFITPLILA